MRGCCARSSAVRPTRLQDVVSVVSRKLGVIIPGRNVVTTGIGWLALASGLKNPRASYAFRSSTYESLLFPTQDHLPLPRGREVQRHQAVGEGRLDERAVHRHRDGRSLRINAEAARPARVDADAVGALVAS